MNPESLAVEDMAKVLTAASGGRWRISVEDLRRDIAAGAPVNADGTMHLLQYGAWLLRCRNANRPD